MRDSNNFYNLKVSGTSVTWPETTIRSMPPAPVPWRVIPGDPETGVTIPKAIKKTAMSRKSRKIEEF